RSTCQCANLLGSPSVRAICHIEQAAMTFGRVTPGFAHSPTRSLIHFSQPSIAALAVREPSAAAPAALDSSGADTEARTFDFTCIGALLSELLAKR
ncbi:unnamed protein product, partial [Polarella glacialis]